MRRLMPYLSKLWVTDTALIALLFFLVIHMFLSYSLGWFGSFRLGSTVLWSAILITGAIAASRNRILRTLVFSWAILAFVFTWVRYWFPHQIFVFIGNSLALVFLVLLTALILSQAFREGPTTSRRIMGAVAAYLIIGLMWSLAYYLVALLVPGAFNIQSSPGPMHGESLQSHLFYFSFVTLTTIGYGDIVPVHPIVRMLTILEGVVGQLFPAILIARLVSLQVQARRGEKKQ